MLILKNIRKDYVTSSETVHALKGVSIAFRDHEFVSILGPSGCGKTTLLNIIGGLDHYTSGDLVIGGRSTSSYTDRDWDVYRNHRVGFIFQSYNLIPHQTVLGNVELALTISGVSRRERIERSKRALDRVGLAGQYYKRPNQLSGGQCQRVAIARALVNDPEILLADEPTGALDTVTSVQIMDLIREISRERLVVMVTHNPELAAQYSTRIVRLLDGNVIQDTSPVTEAEIRAAGENKKPSFLKRVFGKRKKTEKAKMSALKAFRLSARNLISKKGRTAMVGVAGSIGIIGIALVLAFSAGIKGYIASMQDDMLSGNPITITEKAYDLGALTDMMNDEMNKVLPEKLANKVYISSLIEYIAKMDTTRESAAVENVLTKEYLDYVKAMPKEYYNSIILDYGIDLNSNLYTDFLASADSDPVGISITALTAMYTSLLKETDFKDYADYVGVLAPSFAQMPNSPDYILSQYDLVGEGSRIATEAGEIMLVLNSEDELSDLLLARFGFYTQDEFLEAVNKATGKDENGDPVYDEALYKEYFEYEELLGKTLTWYPNSTVFEGKSFTNPMTGETVESYSYSAYSKDFDTADGLELRVVGILTPKDTVNYGSLTSGIYYTPSLVDHILEANAESAIFDYINAIDESDQTQAALAKYYIPFTYTYAYGENDPKTGFGAVGPSLSAADMMGSMMGGGAAFSHEDTKERFIRNLGGNTLANTVRIYPVSFDDKDLVTSYLDAWNDLDGEEITVNGTPVTEREKVTYTDTLELVINMINTMIDIISYALIAFTSVSLVVSTVMIGIITYVSVVERIKEIGVIRSLGGRKRDVSNLFMAETFIIGLLAGLFGVGATYVISFIVNLILEPLISYPNIAALPTSNAILLILLSIGLTLISGLAPARSAARKDPVVALRTE